MGTKCMKGIWYCEGILKKIELAKELMVLDLEQGKEVLIPKQLSQDHLPMSFRYYDPIFMFINEKLDPEKREFFSSKMFLAHQNH